MLENNSPTHTSPAAADKASDTPYYQRHIFFCLNERKNGEDSCSQHHAQEGFDRCKQRIKEADLSGKGASPREQSGLPGPLRWRPSGRGVPRGRLVQFCG